MASEELVTEQFQLLGIDVEREVLAKCVSICQENCVDAETFIERWMAFSLNHLNDASPTLENLDLLARKEFSKRASERPNAPAKEASRISAGTTLTVYGAPATAQSDSNVLSNYMTATPKRVKVEPEVAGHTELRPITYSPTTGKSAKYASRANQGTVVHSYGDERSIEDLSKPNSLIDSLNVNITQVPNEEGDVYTKAMFGFELLHEKASIYDNHIRYLSQCIMQKAGITETSSTKHKTQTEVWVAGRIDCDADARLHPKCVVLQGSWQDSLSQAVPVDLDKLKQYSLFPGQVVLVRGVNPRGDRLEAHELASDAARPAPAHNADMMNTLQGKMSLVFAAGPYTTSDNMLYEPLRDLVAHLGARRPHAAVLAGPFVDCDHAKVRDHSMAETYRSFFEKLMDRLAELQTTSPHTKIYIVASAKDAFHVNIYPTPPYCTRRRHQNITFLPDPCTLNAGGVLLGVTSTDVLMHISQEEISLGTVGDKQSRLAGHVLAQQSYWPLGGAAGGAGGGACADAALWAAHAQLPATPHLLLLPSNFRYCVKEVNGCVVVNPERLTKGLSGGTFARIQIEGGDKLKIAAQILRI